MDDDLPASPFIKKKNRIRPSGSSSSLRSLAASPGPSSLSFNANGEEEEEESSGVVIRSIKKKSTISKVKDRETSNGSSKSKAGRLSFGGGEEDEESDQSFSIKRSTNLIDSPNRRLLRPSGSTTSLRQELPNSLDQANISSSTPSTSTPSRSIYSKEYLNQLKATNLSTPPASLRRNGEYDDLTRSKFGDQLDNISTSIPTTAAIEEAKERRERMRAEGGGSGSDAFISLDVGMVLKGGESRLVREEDELGDGDEDMADFTGAKESIPLGKKANRIAADKMRSGMVEMIQDAEEELEDDEEGREWELAQIRRGEEQRRMNDPAPSKRPYRATPIPTPVPLPSLMNVNARLSTALNTLQVSHEMDSAALTHFGHEREELEAQEKDLRIEVSKIEEKNRWFEEFKAFIEQIAAFLDEKVPALEKVEKDNLSIQKERYEIVTRRRYEDDSDDVSLFTGAKVPTIFSLSPVEETAEVEPEFDEMGRSRREDNTAPRSSVRVARRAARERRQMASSSSPNPDEDSFTDDELSAGDSTDLASAITSLKESLGLIFIDVKADDFRDPNLGIRKKFEEWRGKYGEEYRNAFGGLALVGVWEFWARVEMALWNPFEISQLSKTPTGLDSYSWHSSLSSYGHSSRSESQDQMDEDEDDNEDESPSVINALVTSVVIPRLEKLAKETYDPLSKKQTTRALGLVEEVSYCVEKSSAKFESLVQAFLSQLQATITQSQSLIAPYLELISLPTNSFDPSTFKARNDFAKRQFKLLQNCLKWRRYARGLKLLGGESSSNGDGLRVGEGGSLEEMVVKELVIKVILPVIEAGWSTGGSDLAAKVLALLPPESVPVGLKKRLLEG